MPGVATGRDRRVRRPDRLHAGSRSARRGRGGRAAQARATRRAAGVTRQRQTELRAARLPRAHVHLRGRAPPCWVVAVPRALSIRAAPVRSRSRSDRNRLLRHESPADRRGTCLRRRAGQPRTLAGGGFDVGLLGHEGGLEVLGERHRRVGRADPLHGPLEVAEQLLVDARRQLGAEAARGSPPRARPPRSWSWRPTANTVASSSGTSVRRSITSTDDALLAQAGRPPRGSRAPDGRRLRIVSVGPGRRTAAEPSGTRTSPSGTGPAKAGFQYSGIISTNSTGRRRRCRQQQALGVGRRRRHHDLDARACGRTTPRAARRAGRRSRCRRPSTCG